MEQTLGLGEIIAQLLRRVQLRRWKVGTQHDNGLEEPRRGKRTYHYVTVLPLLLKTPAVAILGKSCYTSLVEEFNYRDTPCIKLAVSKGLGYGIVAGGAIVKTPQILKIISTRSAQGLSLLSYLLETLACIIGLAYNIRHGHPFSTYGETFFVAIQDIIILGLMLHYRKKNTWALVVIFSFFLLANVLGNTTQLVQDDGYVVTSFFISEKTSTFLQKSIVPITLLSKIPQILENYRNKSTGQLSAFAVFNYFAGSLARVYTTLTEVQDDSILYGFLLSTSLNCILAFQMALYWNNSHLKAFKSPATDLPITPKTKKRPTKLD
ncbi:hypothetical protein EC991_003817 [Linnemannia zychae]|nr:hypothetical protein EC991_003817 [Linnemannia zychae]